VDSIDGLDLSGGALDDHWVLRGVNYTLELLYQRLEVLIYLGHHLQQLREI